MAYDDKPSLDELMHYGMPRRSGRYPWGSGKDPYQHCTDFLSRVQYMVDNGVSDEDIAKSMGLTKEQFETDCDLKIDVHFTEGQVHVTTFHREETMYEGCCDLPDRGRK